MTMETSRRQFLSRVAMAAAAGTLPASVARALTLPAARRSGTIADVEHIVVLMQENRAFDHYFGTLAGVRGFGDPRPMLLANGRSVFHQPTPDGKGEVLPFHMDSATTSAQIVKSLDHSWKGDAEEWARYDVWIKHKTPLTMGHFERADIPFYHALADSFTLCDAYYASLHGPTNPNRMYLFTGTSGLAVGDDGRQAIENADDSNWTGDSSRDKPDFAGAGWTTYAERLQASGISWQVYQEYDNFGDNSLAYFKAFRGLAPDAELHRRGRAIVPGSTEANAGETDGGHLIRAFAADVAADRLPQVSWIVAPTKYTEHPEAPPAFGESFTSRLIDALTANPDVWAKTALIINYDENDGFFDHMPAPLPAIAPRWGRSTVDTRGEDYRGQPVGLGVRVPLLVVSPWSRGGWINSQVHDHTSVIRFIERRFGVMEPNITPWRRAVTGDLTSMFDFADPDGSALHAMPATDGYLARVKAAAKLPGPIVPAVQSLPKQEAGQRPARPLAYALSVHGDAGSEGVRLRFANDGGAAAVFNVYAAGGAAGPWFYTVGAGETIDAALTGLSPSGPYAVSVHGPNGFLREFAGDGVGDMASAHLETASDGGPVRIVMKNGGASPVTLAIRRVAYGDSAPHRITLAPGATQSIAFPIADSDHWYDLAVEQEGAAFRRRFAGHVETGRPSRSDPAIGRMVAA